MNKLVQQLSESAKVQLSVQVLKNLDPNNNGSLKDFENAYSELMKSMSAEHYCQMQTLIDRFLKDQKQTGKNTARTISARKKAAIAGLQDVSVTWELYNESIAYAPNKSQELALSYGYRASLFFACHYFQYCLADINRALCLKISDKDVGPLLIKKVKCMKFINHPDVDIFYNECIRLLGNNSKKLKARLKKAYESDDDLDRYHSADLIHKEIQNGDLEEMKKLCPNLEKIEINKDSNNKLILVAAKDIHVGEVVAVQKTFCQIPYIGNKIDYTSCWNCSSLCPNLVPCDCCTIAMFCSESCKAESWSKYHDYECPVMFLFQQKSFRSFLIPIRICIFALKRLGGILPLMKEVYKMSKTDDMKKEHQIVDAKYPSESYSSVYYMSKEIPLVHIDYVELVMRINMFIYVLATQTTIFNKQFKGDVSAVLEAREPKFFAALMLRHFIMTLGLEVSLDLEYNGGHTSVPVCPLFSIMKHSCNPNSVKLTFREHQAIVAIDEIKKGQVISFSCTDEALVGKTKAERLRETGAVFTFPCQCEVCTLENPPKVVSFKELENDPQKLEQLSTIYKKIKDVMQKRQPWTPKLDAEFHQHTAELFENMRPFFAIAPPLCEEVLSYKNFIMAQIYVQKYRQI